MQSDRLCLRVPRETSAALGAEARRRGITLTDLVMGCIEPLLEAIDSQSPASDDDAPDVPIRGCALPPHVNRLLHAKARRERRSPGSLARDIIMRELRKEPPLYEH